MRARIFLTAILTLLFSLGAPAQKPPSAPTAVPGNASSSTASPAPAMTAGDVEAFLDGFVPVQLQRENIAGAVVAVVKDGKVLFAKGYGYADVAKKKPVTTDATLFRPGSISKLFTWTAVMQLVEQGKLDLDRDVNDYLDFKIPTTYPQPITLRHIMTHTAGFEESIKQLFVAEDAPIDPLSKFMPQHIPERIYAPGTTPAYSNYAATLAGYIVERVSGRPFNEYVAENIFKPLGMQHSTFVQPLSAELKPLMSSGYEEGSGKAQGFEVVVEAPAGGLSATADDLARFMVAHLQDGKFGEQQILRPETARLMHSRQAGLNAQMNAMALGFYEESRNGHRIIGHGGDTLYFHSDLHLMLDAGVGFLVSYNSAGKGEISPRSALWSHFADRYFPYTPPAGAKIADASGDARQVAGYYLTSRRSESTLLRSSNAFEQVHVMPQDDGSLEVEPFKDLNGELRRWREVGPLIYQADGGQDSIAFQKDNDGRMLLIISFPAQIFQRVTGVNTLPFNMTVAVFSMSVLALTLIFWPIGWGLRRHYGTQLSLTPQQLRTRRNLRLVCLLDIGFAIALLATVSSGGPIVLLSGKLDPWFRLAQFIALLGAAGSLLAVYSAFSLARQRDLWGGARLWYLLVMLASLGFAWFVIHWNVLSWSLRY